MDKTWPVWSTSANFCQSHASVDHRAPALCLRWPLPLGLGQNLTVNRQVATSRNGEAAVKLTLSSRFIPPPQRSFHEEEGYRSGLRKPRTLVDSHQWIAKPLLTELSNRANAGRVNRKTAEIAKRFHDPTSVRRTLRKPGGVVYLARLSRNRRFTRFGAVFLRRMCAREQTQLGWTDRLASILYTSFRRAPLLSVGLLCK